MGIGLKHPEWGWTPFGVDAKLDNDKRSPQFVKLCPRFVAVEVSDIGKFIQAFSSS